MKTLTLFVLLFTLPIFADSVTISPTPGITVDLTSQDTLFACDNCGASNGGFAFDVYNFSNPMASGWVYLSSSILLVGNFTATAWDASTNTLTAAFSGYAETYQSNGFPSPYTQVFVTGTFIQQIAPCSGDCNGVFGTTGQGSLELSAMPPPVPEPSTLLFVGTGLLGAAWKVKKLCRG